MNWTPSFELEKSGRKVMVVVIREHGGALKGDRMQVSGLRDIPSPSITTCPVGVISRHEGTTSGGTRCRRPTEQLAMSNLMISVS
ncbi:cellulose biosynthesis protein BcsG [Shigella flexneri]